MWTTAILTVMVALFLFVSIFSLALFSKKSVSRKRQATPTGDWKKRGFWLFWLVFAGVAINLFHEFVFPKIPLEWFGVIPDLSWWVWVQIAILVAGVVYLWRKYTPKPAPVIPGQKPGPKPENDGWRLPALVGCFILLLMFDFHGGGEYTSNGWRLYIPLAGCLYYTVAYAGCAMLWIAKNQLLKSIAGLATIAVFIYGWKNGWWIPFTESHTVEHLFYSITLPADPHWWTALVVPVSLVIIAMTGPGYGPKPVLVLRHVLFLVMVSVFVPQLTAMWV